MIQVVQVPQLPDLPPWLTLPPGIIALISVAMVAGAVMILWPLMRAIGRRLEGARRADPALRAEVEHLRARLAEVDQMHARIAELEERLDFTERLLTQRREPERLGQG